MQIKLQLQSSVKMPLEHVAVQRVCLEHAAVFRMLLLLLLPPRLHHLQ